MCNVSPPGERSPRLSPVLLEASGTVIGAMPFGYCALRGYFGEFDNAGALHSSPKIPYVGGAAPSEVLRLVRGIWAQ